MFEDENEVQISKAVLSDDIDNVNLNIEDDDEPALLPNDKNIDFGYNN